MIYLLFSFFGGALAKIADNYSEQRKRKMPYSIVFGILYGSAIVLSGYLKPIVIPLIGGLVAGNAFAGKIDRIEHIVGISIIILFIIYTLGSAGGNGSSLDFTIVFAFAASSFIDEALHETMRKGVLKERPATPIVALILSAYSPLFLLYIIVFDVGYRLAAALSKTL